MPEGPSREDGGRCDSASDNTTRPATINREGEQMALPGQIRVHKIKAWLRPYPVIYSMVAKAYHNSGFDRIESAASAQPLIDRLRANFYRKYALDRSPSPSGVSPNVAVVLSALRCAYAFDPRTTHGRDPDASKKVTSDRHRFVYCSIPNAASGGIIRGLRESFGSANLVITRGSLAVLLEKRPELADYYKFTVVRNPWSRVVSCYHRKILNANTLGKLEAMSRYPGLRPKMPFERFVEWLCSDNGRDEVANNHWTSQSRLLAGSDGRVACERIARLETMTRDLAVISSDLGIGRFAVPKIHNSADAIVPPQHACYRDYYTARTRNLIARRYEQDIDEFRYTFSE